MASVSRHLLILMLVLLYPCCVAKPQCGKRDLVFVVDSSASIGVDDFFYQLMPFVDSFLDNLNIKDDEIRVGLVIYSSEVEIQFLLNEFIGNRRGIHEAIAEAPHLESGTNTSGALHVLRTEMFLEERGDRPDAENVCILITDGESTDPRKTILEAEGARNEGIRVYVIGIGLADSKEIDGIANKPLEEHRFTVQDFDGLSRIQLDVTSAFCSHGDE